MGEVCPHGVKRIRKRLGIKKTAAERVMEQALNGLHPKDFAGRFRSYLDRRSIMHGGRHRITPDGIFCFAVDGTLITVYDVPPAFRKVVLREWARRG